MKNKLLDVLACPDCKFEVSSSDENKEFKCLKCNRKFYAHSNIPIFFSVHSKEVMYSGENHYDGTAVPTKRSPISRLAGKLSKLSNISIGETLHDRLRDQYIDNSPADKLILNLGSGIDNIIMKENIINFDIFPHENTDLCGDGHYLPFLSDSLDGVWLCAVLEHMANPFQVASEVYRVLKPGGFILAGAPFMYQLHGSPHDYFRYTDSGLRSVFKNFKEVEAGQTHTLPTGTLITLISEYSSLFSSNKKLSLGIKLFMKLVMTPFRFIDLYFRKRPDAKTLSGGFCFLGLKER